MKKLLLVAVLCFGMAGTTFAQKRSCGSSEYLRNQLLQDPSMLQRRNAIENFSRSFKTNKRGLATNAITPGQIVKIPVVVHIVYNTSAQNITDAQIQSQITVLNQDFRKLNTDVSKTPSAFTPLVADAQIEFELAKVDPSGNATTGITRTSTTKTSFTDDDKVKYTSQGGKDAWPRDKYLNLWICNLTPWLGYAQFPGGAAATDGVVIGYKYFGTTGAATAPYNKGRTATHEVGHWLNLYHIWGDDGTSCSGSDEVSDTPNQADENYGCPTFPAVSCSNGPNGDLFMNYMDYTDDACMYMFTEGQKSRMRALFAAGGARESFTTGGGGGTISYCSSKGNSTVDEWIEKVTIGTISNTSGNNSGYGNYTALSTNLSKGSSYTVTITPKWSGAIYSEGYRVWVDYNKDGDFADSGEQVYTRSATTSASVSGSFTVPSTALTGNTRMRVSMKYNGSPTACETFSYGEVEDYTVNILADKAREAFSLEEGEGVTISPNPASAEVNISFNLPVDEPALKIYLNGVGGKKVFDSKVSAVRGWNTYKIQSTSFNDGLYLIHLEGTKFKEVRKVLIRK